MIYDGIVANLLSIEMEEVHKALFKQFGKKKAKAAELNWGACQAGHDYAAQTFTKSDPYRVQRMNSTAGKIIIEGNAAAALGCVFAGVTVVTWYPITPSSSLVESMIGYLKRFRSTRKPASPRTPWCRRKTNCPPLAWCWARHGRARARLLRRPVQAFR